MIIPTTTPSSQSLSAHAPVLEVPIYDKIFTLHRAANLEELWDNMVENMCARHEKRKRALAKSTTQLYADAFDLDPFAQDAFESDERLPYWTELWPSSIALSRWIYSQKERVAQKTCLDLGCGLGLTALVGHMCGAHIIAMDYEEDAVQFAHKNMRVNAEKGLFDNTSAPPPLWTVMDWRAPAVKRGSLDLIWGGDIMYEKRFVQPVLRFIDYALDVHGKAWIAEPCRSVFEHFQHEVHARRWQWHKIFETPIEALYAQTIPVTVNIWELSR